MKNTYLKCLIMLCAGLFYVLSSFSYANEPETYGQQIGLKATSSLANLTTSWLEIPKNIINVTNAKDSNIFYGFIGGTFKGMVVMTGRLGAGVADLLTIPLPTLPIAYPIYVWNDFDADTSFEPVFRLYDKRRPSYDDYQDMANDEDTVAQGDADDDGDGVVNAQDICPDTPNGAKVDSQGCWAYHGVFFDFDQDVIKPEFLPLFDNAINVLNLNPELTVEIQGYTDNIGDADYNLRLSQRRAEAVKDYLIANGIDPSRLTVKGFGMLDPAMPNDTEEGRAFNRRVYFKRTDIAE